MPNHEYFEELAAVAALGELHPAGLRELSLHLADCSQCRRISDEYEAMHVARPALGAEMIASIELRREDAKSAMIRSLAAQGLQQPLPTDGESHIERNMRLWGFRPVLASAAAVLVVVSAILIMRREHHTTLAAANTEYAIADLALSRQQQVIALAPKTTSDKRPDDTQSNNLENALREERQRSAKLEAALAEKDRDLALSASEKGALEQQVASAGEEIRKTQSMLNAKTEQLQKLESTKSQDAVELVSLRYQVQDLTQKMDDQKQNLDRERQLLSSGRDIRDIIGARNLHIMDVYDTDPDGTTKKSFARAFYTEGKSLIFYAYDLPARHVEDGKFTYAAWGEKNGNKKTVRNLGLLLNDDKGQRRWVLNFSDPKVLSEIDSVFITLERADFEGAGPSGKRILTAYLESQMNHP